MRHELEEGDKCPQCLEGTVEYVRQHDCSCHISPPCSACTDAPLTCDCCGETFEDDTKPYVERKYEYRYDYADRFGFIPEYQKANAETDFLYEVDTFSFWRTGAYSDDFGSLFFTTRVNPYKINWKHRPHSNASMVKYGWAPPWVKREEVEKAVIGTFGGRFTFFKQNGQFEFIAYTD